MIKIAANRCLNNYRNQSSEDFINSVDCLVRSSNRCMAQIAQKVGREKQKSFLQKIGLLDEYLLEIHETGSPILPERWTDNSMIAISFGQGLSVVPLSFASSVATIVNGGYKIQPTLNFYNTETKKGIKIISKETSENLIYAMRQVVKNGSGKKADIPGYAVIGKTGTADIPCNGSYTGCGNRTSFVGAFLATIGLMLLAPILARVAFYFGPAEYFALYLLAFCTLGGIGAENQAKSAIAVCLGLGISMIGVDNSTGMTRFTGGNLHLYDGVDFLAVSYTHLTLPTNREV